jgi:hypothetical protein
MHEDDDPDHDERCDERTAGCLGHLQGYLTSRRKKLFVVHGILHRRAAAVRLARIGAIELDQTLLGRMLGYGTLCAGELEIDYVPAPRRVSGLVAQLNG